MTHDERIARYATAYEAANNTPLAYEMVYDRGWYRLRNSWGRQIGCWRAARLDSMIQMLEWRGSEDYREFIAQGTSPGTAETGTGSGA